MINEGYSFSHEDPISLGIPVYKTFRQWKTRPAKPPDAPTIPIGAAHISFSGQHRISQPMSKTSPRVSPRWRCKWLWFGPTLRQALARGGAVIKMTLGLITPKGNIGGGEANGKTNVGPCWRSFIQSELSRGSHKSPNRVRNAKSGNIKPV